MEFSHDSKFLAICDEYDMRMWNIHERQEIWSQRLYCSHLAFSPDDKFIVCTKYSSNFLFDVESGRTLARLEGHKPISFSVFFSGEDTIITYNRLHKQSQQWRIALVDAYSGDLPMVFLPVSEDVDDLIPRTEISQEKLRFESDRVWIVDELGRRVCWIPHDWTFSSGHYSPPYYSYGNKIAWVADSGRVCVFDFSVPQVS